MKHFNIGLCLIVIISVGCTRSYPRYGSGGESPSGESRPVPSQNSVNTTIKLGRILQEYLGKPYAGRSRYDPGLDCSLFTGEVFKKYAKISLPRTSEDQFNAGSPIKNGQLAFGDLVFFRTDGNGISHVGVYVGNDEFIHASTSIGVIISKLDEKYWAKRFMGARRVF